MRFHYFSVAAAHAAVAGEDHRDVAPEPVHPTAPGAVVDVLAGEQLASAVGGPPSVQQRRLHLFRHGAASRKEFPPPQGEG